MGGKREREKRGDGQMGRERREMKGGGGERGRVMRREVTVEKRKKVDGI